MDEMFAAEALGGGAPPEVAATAPAPLPEQINVDDLHSLATPQLVARAKELNLRINPERTRHQIIFDLLRLYAERGVNVLADGILEMASENHGFLRWPRCNFRPET